jgi:hypothetical protein
MTLVRRSLVMGFAFAVALAAAAGAAPEPGAPKELVRVSSGDWRSGGVRTTVFSDGRYEKLAYPKLSERPEAEGCGQLAPATFKTLMAVVENPVVSDPQPGSLQDPFFAVVISTAGKPEALRVGSPESRLVRDAVMAATQEAPPADFAFFLEEVQGNETQTIQIDGAGAFEIQKTVGGAKSVTFLKGRLCRADVDVFIKELGPDRVARFKSDGSKPDSKDRLSFRVKVGDTVRRVDRHGPMAEMPSELREMRRDVYRFLTVRGFVVRPAQRYE